MDVGAPVWAFDSNEQIWHEAAVIHVDGESDTVECSLVDASESDQLVLEGDHVVPPAVPPSSEFVTVRKRRNSCRRGSVRRMTPVPMRHVLPRDHVESYHTVEDLTKLVHLHEPAILHVLRKRFFHGLIYTSTGSILVALNPFRRLELYSDMIKERYYRHGNDDLDHTLPPHVYSVADQAFRTMLRRNRPSAHSKSDQTILVSGESGAGKTETTKLIMNYLAYVSICRQRQQHQYTNHRMSDQATIHDRVLESNPILEAFGNARTNRNNNSSRFGKFIKLGFSISTGEMLGASISTYLLERVRLVSQANGERNYHIFYELCSGASSHERTELELLDVQAFKYLNKSDCFTRLDGVDDAASYAITRHAMTSIGMSIEEQLSVMKVVAAVLHLGNVVFVPDKNGKEGSVVDRRSSSSSVSTVCRLLGITMDALETTLCTKQIKAGAEFITMRLPVDQATSTRDTVVKTLYANLFDWLVARINASIRYQEDRQDHQFIGVVDIFGFEIFEHNSLEQLCINFANEKLQQLFASFVFRMEQEQYVAEGIPWQFVECPNNDLCVQMLEIRPIGLFSLLDEQCLMPRGNDEKLANRYYESFGSGQYASTCFSVSKLQRARQQFVIHHYAGDVCYTGDGFCEKNKDHLHTEAVDLMKTSTSPFVRALFERGRPTDAASSSSSRRRKDDSSGNGPRRRSGIMSSTVVSQFKSQLAALLEVINSTEPHFIRCIKPNDVASSSDFDRRRVAEQLRCSGVVEAVKISRSGYPVRFPHDTFVKTYDCIVPTLSYDRQASNFQMAAKKLVAALTERLELFSSHGPPSFQVGKTKVFCVQQAHQALETARAKALHHSVLTLQRYGRGFACRKQFLRKRRSAIQIQACWRRVRCQRAFQRHRQEHNCAIRIQTHVRRWVAQVAYRKIHACILIQSFVRGWLVRRELSANTLSFDRDVSYVGSIEEHGISSSRRSGRGIVGDYDTTSSYGGSFSSATPSSTAITNALSIERLQEQNGSFLSDMNDPDGRYGGSDSRSYSQSSRATSGRRTTRDLSEYEPPQNVQLEYEIVWECGLLGLYFESDPESGMPIVRRVHESLSNCADIFEVSRGDVLLAVGKVKVKKGDIRRILSLLQEVQKPVRLLFKRNPTESFRMRAGSLELLGEEDYEVLWKEGVPLGLGFRPCPETGLPSVLQANGNPSLPGMFNVRVGDYLIFINEFSTSGVKFQKVIDILESGPRPAVLRFRHNDPIDDFRISNPQEEETTAVSTTPDGHYMRQSRSSLNPKVDHSLYYITWKEEDGPLGIVVKQESSSYYPRVINVKNEGAVCRESQKNRVEIGDMLLSINNNNISKMGFGAAMRLLQKGPKPLLLMFQRPRDSYGLGPKSCDL